MIIRGEEHQQIRGKPSSAKTFVGDIMQEHALLELAASLHTNVQFATNSGMGIICVEKPIISIISKRKIITTDRIRTTTIVTIIITITITITQVEAINQTIKNTTGITDYRLVFNCSLLWYLRNLSF